MESLLGQVFVEKLVEESFLVVVGLEKGFYAVNDYDARDLGVRNTCSVEVAEVLSYSFEGMAELL